MESEILAERILLDLKNVFRKDPMIDEFDILPVTDSTCNKCPVIHEVHKVALESWCVRHVYLFAYSNFMKWRSNPYNTKSCTLLNWTRAILLINPDLETAWNARKELIKSGQHDIKEDLKFASLVLSRKPKSSQVFAHRKWLLTQLWSSSPSSCTVGEVIEHELNLCNITANRYFSNYYSWCHRMWIIQHLLNFCSKVISEELLSTEQWVSTHVSDHSGFHYRQFLMSCRYNLKPEDSSRTCLLHGNNPGNSLCHCHASISSSEYYVLLMKELLFLSELHLLYAGHETLWNHRRFLIHEIVHLPISAKQCSQIDGATRCCAKLKDNAGIKKYKIEFDLNAWNLEKEETFLKQCAKHGEWERQLIGRHETWLKKFMLPNIKSTM